MLPAPAEAAADLHGPAKVAAQRREAIRLITFDELHGRSEVAAQHNQNLRLITSEVHFGLSRPLLAPLGRLSSRSWYGSLGAVSQRLGLVADPAAGRSFGGGLLLSTN